MAPGISISKIWSDEHVFELKVKVADGVSCFANTVYVEPSTLVDLASKLSAFQHNLAGGLLEVRFGEFGPGRANGAFHGRFEYKSPLSFRVACRQESAFEDFGEEKVASTATMYLQSEPERLHLFISELRLLAAGAGLEAWLSAS